MVNSEKSTVNDSDGEWTLAGSLLIPCSHRQVFGGGVPVEDIDCEFDRAAENRCARIRILRIYITSTVGEVESVDIFLACLPIGVDGNCGPLAVGVRCEGIDLGTGLGVDLQFH